MMFFAIAAFLLTTADPHVPVVPAVTPAPVVTPIVAATVPPAGSPAASPVAVATAAPVPAIESERDALLGSDRAAATTAVENVSLVGGEAAVGAIADFLGRWARDKEMERRGRSALTRMPIESSALARVILGDADPRHRAWAAWTAGTHELPATGDALLKAIKDPDAVVRARAVVALALLGDTRAQDPLMKIVVHDPDADTRQRASDALVMLSAPRLPKTSIDTALIKLRASDPFARLEGAHELEKARDRSAVGPLLALLETERDVEVRRAAVSALSSLGDEIAVPALIRIAKKDSTDVRQYAIGALATLDDGRALEPLAEFSKDPDPSVRRFSLRALAFLKREASLAPVLDALSDPVPDVRSEALKAVAKIADRSAADRVANRIEREPDPSIRQFACATLGNLGAIGNAAQERALVKALDDEDTLVQSAAVAALAKIGTRAGSEKPLERLIDREKKKKPGARDPVLLRIADDAMSMVKAR